MPTKTEPDIIPLALDASVHVRWNAVLAALPAIGKDSVNKQQGFNYRSVDTVLDYVKPLFARLGIHVIPEKQSAFYDERQVKSGATMYVCKLTVDWRIYGVSGDSFTAQTVGEGTDMGDKATSKAQTMAFKYLLWPALAIASNEDPDGETPEQTTATQPSQQVRRPQPPNNADPNLITTPQRKKIEFLTDRMGYAMADLARIVDEVNPPWPELGLSQLTKAQASSLIDALD